MVLWGPAEPGFLCFSLQFSLMVTFPEVPLGIFLFCVCVITIGAVQVGPLPAFPPHVLSFWSTHCAHVLRRLWPAGCSESCADRVPTWSACWGHSQMN